MPRPHSGFAKRQKELARSEKRKSKLARRQKSKEEGEAGAGEPIEEPGDGSPGPDENAGGDGGKDAG
jgi:hypothetical protein